MLSVSEKFRTSGAVDDAVEVLLQFGSVMMRAGNPAARTRERIELIARKMHLPAVSVGFTFDSIIVSVRSSAGWTTAHRAIGPVGINIWRIGELDRLATTICAEQTPRAVATSVAKIESILPLYSRCQVAVAIAAASTGFAFLNGAGSAEMLAAAAGGGFGQALRSWLQHRSLNQYGVAALSAAAASTTFVIAAAIAQAAGLALYNYPAGFIASVLFLVPGVPLIAGLFDLTQGQTTAALGRLANGFLLLLSVASGLSIVVEIVGIDLVRQAPLQLSYPTLLALRAAASVIASSAFAVLFNSPMRGVFAAGLVALVANDLRLALIDSHMMLAPAAFLATVSIGIAALLLSRCFAVDRMAVIVPAIVIMIPGIYAFEMVVLFNRGEALQALQAASACAFVVGALAMGLAAVRSFQRG